MDPVLRQIAARFEARKDLAIAKVAPKLVGIEDVAEAEEILKELQAEMLDEPDEIERDFIEEPLHLDWRHAYIKVRPQLSVSEWADKDGIEGAGPIAYGTALPYNVIPVT